MNVKEMMEHLKYSKCDCEVDYHEELKVFNGVCPNHEKSILMVDGLPIKTYLSKVKNNRLARKPSEIV